MVEVVEGTRCTFELLTSRGKRTIDATVVRVDRESIRMRTRDGREASVPRRAILAATNVQAGVGVASNDAATTQLVLGQKLEHLRAFVEPLVASAGSTATKDAPSLVPTLEQVRQDLEDLYEFSGNDDVLGDRSRKSLRLLAETIGFAIQRIGCTDFNESVRVRGEYEASRRDSKRLIDRLSNTRTSKTLKDLLRAISQNEAKDWRNFSAGFEAHPRIVSAGRLTLNLATTGEFELPIRIALDDSRGDARNIQVVLDQHRGVELVGNAPRLDRLAPNTTTNVRVRLMDRRRQGARDEIKVVARLQYLGPNNERLFSTQHKLHVRILRPATFQPIQSPFRQFASGIPVDNPDMFFGREALIGDIFTHLVKNPVGRCYGLYGQKRTEKSSVVEQVRKQIEESGALVAALSMAVVDRSSMTESFVSEVLDQLREQVARRLDERRFASLLTRWPDAVAIRHQPLASFRRACTAARALTQISGEAPMRIVVIVDEFTYLFELLRRDNVAHADQQQLRDFMRQWKSLLEAKTFSALVVGQDTMPYFLRAFPNEFSVMHTERLDYLSHEETEALADLPIRRPDGTSRFAGYALPAVHAWTSGHPYFTQILCDRVVSTINNLRLTEISDFEVDSAVESLLSGVNEIGYHRFDCLLSADNTGVIVSDSSMSHDGLAEDATEVSFKVLHRLARMSGVQNKPVAQERLELTRTEQNVVSDLLLRQVIFEKDGDLQIRVLLFSEYLRRMSA